jgi:hypothetical protein
VEDAGGGVFHADVCRRMRTYADVCCLQVRRRVEDAGGGVFHLCSVNTRATLRHGQLGYTPFSCFTGTKVHILTQKAPCSYAVADWRRAQVEVRAWVSGRTVGVSIQRVDMSDWTRTARAIATALLPHAAAPHHGRWA